MEAYSSSSSSSAYMKAASNSSYHLSLHSVRKSPLKTMKKPIAPLPPTRPKVYKVDPMNFRDLVQKLTGASDQSSQAPQQRRLKSVAPLPINVSPGDAADAPLQLLPSPPFSALYKELIMSDAKPQKLSDCAMASSNSLGLTLSPSSYNCFAYLS